ncbi:nitrogen-fixing NifU domain protein [hydrothermal vent metagenome]|uniref:Nitrogen-fixing NifU domain protein n=1 Tax=hydrothermal vent metagenome TaxID=652676 RepID=A0A3B1BT40_9ZZZZ
MLKVLDVDLTPNPQALKFILNQKLLNHESRSFNNAEEAMNDPFAKAIFDIDGVVSIFYMDRFVTIEKDTKTNWGKIQKPFSKLVKVFDPALIPEEKIVEGLSEEATAKLKQITEIIDLRVKPALAGDGGGLEILGLDENVLTIRYQGACGTCPSSIRGTLSAIENLLKREIDSNLEVVSG